MLNGGWTGEPTLVNCVFTGNAADSGGGYYNEYGNATLANCILWGNLPGADVSSQIAIAGGTPQVDYCCIQGWGGSLGGAGNFGDDPLFADADGADNVFGTADDDLHVLPGSPCIDVGDTAAVPAWLFTDFDGDDRILHCRVDVGVDESPDIGFDCNGNGVSDGCDLAGGSGADCNRNGILDECDIATGTSTDFNGDGVPDECVATALYVDAAAPAGGDGLSWQTAFNDLQQALIVAQNTEIRVAGGTYLPTTPGGPRSTAFVLASNVALRGGYAGSANPLNPDARNPDEYTSTLSGDIGVPGEITDNSYNVVIAVGAEITPLLEGLTITAGYADGSGSEGTGGGLRIQDCSPLVVDCLFVENEAAVSAYGCGGALACNNASPTVIDCRFIDNVARSGGAIVVDQGSPTLINCVLSGNAASSIGGAIYAGIYGELTAINCLFTANQADEGGATYGIPGIRLFNCTVVGNTADTGGGVTDALEIRNCIVWGNGGTDEADQIAGLVENISYSCVQGWTGTLGGVGNFGDDPQLIDPNGGDFHVLSSSPCVDAGDSDIDVNSYESGLQRLPGVDLDLNMRRINEPNAPDTGHGRTPLVDIGCYEAGSPSIPAHLYVDADAVGDRTGVSWSAAFDDLQEALATARAARDSVTQIWVAEGSYRPAPPGGSRNSAFRLLGGVTLYGGFAGWESDPNDRDYVLQETVLSGDLNNDDLSGGDPSENSYHVVTATSVGASGALDGFVISNGNADGVPPRDRGAGLYISGAGPTIRNCALADNSASTEAGGLDFVSALPTIANLVLYPNVSPIGNGGVLSDSRLELQGPLWVTGGFPEVPVILDVRSSELTGSGGVSLDDNAELYVSDAPWYDPAIIRTTIGGRGDIVIAAGQELIVAAGALIDLSGEDPNTGCADPNGSVNWGTIYVDGALICRDSTIRNTNVQVNAGDLADGTTIYNNEINLVQNPPGWGGEFFVEGSSTIECNIIRSEGDRYLDLDPDPSIDPNDRPIIRNNKIYVTIVQGVSGEQGELLELRAVDHDHDDPTLGGGMSGAHELASSAGYDGTWAFEELEVLGHADDPNDPNDSAWGAKVNLTNRPGFVFQDPNLPAPETLYVKKLKLHPNAVLNTGLQRLYYQSLVDENGTPLQREPNDPSAPMANGSRIVDIPLLGFSLKVIAMEDETEFAVRVRPRLRDSSDEQPAEPPYKEGRIARISDFADPSNGVVQLLTRDPNALQASSVSAHGAFARAAEDEILVEFLYRFCAATDPNTVLIVYLSDSPEPREAGTPLSPGDCDEHSCCCAWVYPPAAGRPGSVGSDEWATFFGVFPRGGLNFTRGTYVELELRGQEACLEVDDWDPQIYCSQTCHDLNANNAVSNRDFLLLMAEAGQERPSGKGCLDSRITYDQYVDLGDVLAWDAMLTSNPPPANLCEPPVDQGGLGTGVQGLPTSALLLAGKPNGPGLQGDRLYAFTLAGQATGTPLTPADCATGGNHRGNGRLIQATSGTTYQVHATQGLLQLDTAERVVTPGSRTFDGKNIYIGVTPTGDVGSYPLHFAKGLPLLDVAPDPQDPNRLYVVPVVVHDPSSGDYYKAAAQLTLSASSYSVTQLYGIDPASEANCTHTIPPEVSECRAQGQREIEVDAFGNVFVLSASAQSESNDWLMVYDANNGDERLRLLVTDPVLMSSDLESPTALLVSQHDPNWLYLASGVDREPNQAGTSVYRCQIQRTGNAVTGVALNAEIVVTQPVGTGYGFGHLATIAALCEDPSNGDLHVIGLTMPRLDPALPPYHSLFDDSSGQIQSTPTWALLPAGSTAPMTASVLSGHDLALPLAVVCLAGPSVCPGDVSCDDQVDFGDINLFVDAMLCVSDPDPEGCWAAQYPGCPYENADVDESGTVSFGDINPFVDLLILHSLPIMCP